MKINSQKDFWSGAMFIVFGVAFAWGATNYTIGTGARMGPGYFPLMLGVLLGVLGAAILLKSLWFEISDVMPGGNIALRLLLTVLKAMSTKTPDGDPIGKWAWRPLLLVLSSVVAFGVLIVGVSVGGFKTPQFGIVVAIFALTILASLADEFRWRDVLILATALSIFSYLVFVLALKLPFPMLPSFIAG